MKFTTFDNTRSQVVNHAILEALIGISLTIEREKIVSCGTGTGSVFAARGSLLSPSAFEFCVTVLLCTRLVS